MANYQENERRVPWPDGVQCPVIFNFHPDGESLAIAVDKENANRPNTQTMYTYGPRVGMQRILRLLRKYDIKASFYWPAITAERHSYCIEWIVEDGHEIGCHGYTHDWPNWLDPDVEEEHLDRQIEVLTRLGGTRLHQPWLGVQRPDPSASLPARYRVLGRLVRRGHPVLHGDRRRADRVRHGAH